MENNETLIWTFVGLIAYIAVANIIAAWLTWKIFDRLGWSRAAKLLNVGFVGSAIAWTAFTGSNELLFNIPMWFRTWLIMGGLVTKAVCMSFLVYGFWVLYKASKTFIVVRTDDNTVTLIRTEQ